MVPLGISIVVLFIVVIHHTTNIMRQWLEIKALIVVPLIIYGQFILVPFQEATRAGAVPDSNDEYQSINIRIILLEEILVDVSIFSEIVWL